MGFGDVINFFFKSNATKLKNGVHQLNYKNGNKMILGKVAKGKKIGVWTTYFENGPPYRILVAYRDGQASRQIQNMKEYEEMLRLSFPSPDYIIRMFDTSDPMLTFAIQLQAVGESHIVISNHGAFEGNMIYMKNSSLLIELFGNYGNNEIHTFQRLAIMFGIYYARLHSLLLVDHQEIEILQVLLCQ